jgi:putative PIN family toxin of toxin-antitoxin system
MRVVIDTNVFISAMLSTHGPPGRILHSAREGSGPQLILSRPLISEYRRVALYPSVSRLHSLTPSEVDRFIDGLRTLAILVDQLPDIQIVTDDPDDNLIVATALAGEADYIVSGDRHLLRLQAVDEIRVVTPAAFLLLMG